MTLSHKAQVRRFTSDLLRVLKSVASKQVPIVDFGTLFEKTLGRAFDPVDYGLCSLDDLLSQVSENTVVIGHLDGQKSVAIPKREQTPEEIERTKAFAKEVSFSKNCLSVIIWFNKIFLDSRLGTIKF